MNPKAFYSHAKGGRFWSQYMEIHFDGVPRKRGTKEEFRFGEWQEWVISDERPTTYGDWYVNTAKSTKVHKVDDTFVGHPDQRKLEPNTYWHCILHSTGYKEIEYPFKTPLVRSRQTGMIVLDPYVVDGIIISLAELEQVTRVSHISGERHMEYNMRRDGVTSNWYTIAEYTALPRCRTCGALTASVDTLCARCEYEKIKRRIRPYHQQPPHGIVFYKKQAEELFMGVEIEQDCHGTGNEQLKISEAVKLLMKTDPDEKKFYLNSDGSLGQGFEMITMPHSMEMWMEEQHFWKPLMTELVGTGMRSHDTHSCGQHIHVSKAGLKEGAIEAIITMYEANFPDFLHFSRRTLDELQRWAVRYTYNAGERKTARKDFNPKAQPQRGCAINQQPRNTLEFRFFKGTLNPTTLYANLQLVWSMCLMANKAKYRDRAEEVTFDEIINFSGFSEIKEYWEIRKGQKRERIKENA